MSQDDGPFKSMVADTNKWVLYEAEPCIWALVVVRRSWAGGACTDAALRALLQSLHASFTLLHGPMGRLLEQDPTGFALRRALQPLLDEAGSRLLRPQPFGRAAAGALGGGRGPEPGSAAALLANPLAPCCPAAVPLLRTSHPTFLAVQCLVSQLLVASFYGARHVAGCIVLWGGAAVWSTLGGEDTAALVGLAQRALLPAARAAARARTRLTGPAAAAAGLSGASPLAPALAGSAEPAFETLLSPLQWRPGGGIHPGPPHPAASASTSAASTPTPTAGGGSALAASAAAVLGLGASLGLGSLGGGLLGGAPQLPVSSSAAVRPASPVQGQGQAAGAASNGGGGGGVGRPLPPFLASFLRPRLRPAQYTPGGAALPLPGDAVLPMAHVWLRGTSEWAQLLPYHHPQPHQPRGEQLMVLALLADGPPPPTEVLAALAAVLQRGCAPVAAALAAEFPPRAPLWHERGHRYCYTDEVCGAARFTPPRKVQTLSPHCLRHLAHLRAKADEWAAGARQPAGEGEEGTEEAAAAPSAAPAPAGACEGQAEAECELVVRTGLDAWLVLRSAGQVPGQGRGGEGAAEGGPGPGGWRRLYAASEGGGEVSLAAAVAHTDALCDRLFPGVFMPP